MKRKRIVGRIRRARKQIEAQHTETPTPERLAMAGASVRQDAVRAYHCEDSQIERLASRGALAPGDESRNRMLLNAAERYYEHWYLSGMSGLGAVDLTRAGGGDGSNGCGMPAHELAAHHRGKYRTAIEALGPYFSAAVDPIVLAEQDVVAVGISISGYRDRGKATAVAMDRLRGGLECLAVHFGIGRLDAKRTGMHPNCHESEKRPEGRPRALSRHLTLAGR